MSDDVDFALLSRWRDGDRSAGEELFLRQFDHLYRFFASKCNGDIDELVQSTLLACLNAKQQFRADSTFKAYMFTVARHELYKYLRARRRDQERLDFSTVSVADLATTPGTRIARDQAHRRLLDALRELPVEQQTLLELYYWEDLDIATLARSSTRRRRPSVRGCTGRASSSRSGSRQTRQSSIPRCAVLESSNPQADLRSQEDSLKRAGTR